MAPQEMQDKLDNFVNQMIYDGLLNETFQKNRELQTPSDRKFISDLTTLFIEQTGRTIAELDTLIDTWKTNPGNRKKIDDKNWLLKGSCTSFGAPGVLSAVERLQNQFKESRKNVESCKVGLDAIRREFSGLKIRLQTMIQLENDIHFYNETHAQR